MWFKRKVAIVDSEHFVQDTSEVLAGRTAMTVNAEKVLTGDLIRDDGWIKEVERVLVEGERVVLHFQSNPFDPCVTYQSGHPALVYRVIADVEP
jgi:hypothetical protein